LRRAAVIAATSAQLVLTASRRSSLAPAAPLPAQRRNPRLAPEG
jgi:hypothetical protein